MKSQSKVENIRRNSFLVYALFIVGIKDVSESAIKVFLALAVTFIRLGLVLFLYAVLFSHNGDTILGLSFETIAWSMFLYFVFLYINPRGISTAIQKDLQTGKIEVIVSKPVNYLLYKLGEHLGSSAVTFFACSLSGAVLMAVFVGVPENIFSLHFAVTFPIVIVLSFIISFEIFSILGLLSFWMEDIAPLRWVVDKSMMILGGAYFPVAFFPEILKNISLYSPIGASQFVAYSAYTNWSAVYLKMFAIQWLWIVVLGYILYIVQKRAFLKLSVNGG